MCRARVGRDRLEQHIDKVHSGGATGGKSPKRSAGTRRLRKEHLVLLAAVAVVVGALAVYAYTNPPSSPEEPSPETAPPAGEIYPTGYARLETSKGPIVIALYGNETPNTVRNFIDYVGSGYYSGTIFHRVVAGFVIQGGGLNPDLTPKEPTRPPIKLEINPKLKNERGTVAMARTSDPDSATSQFFINLANNTHLDPSPSNPGYAVFGRVVRGMEIVEVIAHTPVTNRNGYENVPEETIMILSAMLISTPDG